ncbi:MAG: tetratricopeptide repeat protein [Sedimentisphaerales bacterium]|nr:tetratricopeptide repeat protein [Sedimentisphaerales bacterium]
MKSRYDRAIEQLNEVINSKARTDRNHLLELQTLGQAFIYKGEYEKAKEYLNQALDLSIKVNNRSCDLYDFLGFTHFKTGDWVKALYFSRLACQHSKSSFFNRIYMKYMGTAESRKLLLEEHEDMLPILTAYYKQNTNKFKLPHE